jgi:hypothetical protein
VVCRLAHPLSNTGIERARRCRSQRIQDGPDALGDSMEVLAPSETLGSHGVVHGHPCGYATLLASHDFKCASDASGS